MSDFTLMLAYWLMEEDESMSFLEALETITRHDLSHWFNHFKERMEKE